MLLDWDQKWYEPNLKFEFYEEVENMKKEKAELKSNSICSVSPRHDSKHDTAF